MNDKPSKRKKTSGYDHSKADARKDKRRAAAEARQSAYSALTPDAKLERLDFRDLEARRERAWLYPIVEWMEIAPNKRKVVQP